MVEGSQLGSYRLISKLGEGGMGEVWLAEHAMLGRRAAVKVLHREYSHRAEIVQRFFNEARAATAISDPGIVQIYDFGNHTDGSAYIVMELLEGETLSKRLGRVGRFAPVDALRVMRQVSTSLGAAHAHNIVHRDLKPENIFIVRDPEVVGGERAKVLDFGIAKLIGDKGVKTHTRAIMGTPTFMSPEQCRGAGHVDQRSDVYALGCLLYALLTGKPPFDAEGTGEIMVMHLTHHAPMPSSSVAEIPRDIDAIVARCLAKNPAERYASGAELATAISAYLGMPVAQVSSSPGAAATLPGLPGNQTTLSNAVSAMASSPGRTSSRGWVIGIAATVVAVGGIATAIALSSSSDRTASDTPAKPEPKRADEPKPATEAPKPDPRTQLSAAMKSVFARFVAWSRDHAGAPCPTLDELAITATDPWGHPIALTCSDQPRQQIVGAISAGPDGAFGTNDDIASWQLGNDVTEIVAGEHWASAPVTKAAATSLETKKRSDAKTSSVAKRPSAATKTLDATKTVDAKKPSEPAAPPDAKPPANTTPTKPAIPLDENGLPVKR